MSTRKTAAKKISTIAAALASATSAGDERCRVAAFHEAGHIVIAICLGLAISSRGICVDNFANGRTWFAGATDGEDVADSDADAVTMAILAGRIAHRKMSEHVGHACQGDDNRVNELLEKRYCDPSKRENKLDSLRIHTENLVTDKWTIVSRVAEALWAKSWMPKYPNRHWPQEKKLTAEELGPLVTPMITKVDDPVSQPK